MADATMIVPIGSFTPDLSRRVRETASRSALQHEVVISMQSTKHYSWSALCDLADWLHSAFTPHPIRLTGGGPGARALLRELGVHSTAFDQRTHARDMRRIVVV